MFCHKFEKLGYLFLSGEISSSEKKRFKKHLKQCADCRKALKEVKETWRLIEHLPLESPDALISKNVIQYSKGKHTKNSFSDRIQGILTRLQNNQLTWVIPTAAAIAVTIFLVFPFGADKSNSDLYAWNDQFYLETDLIENELDSIESGALFSSFSIEQNNGVAENKLGSISNDLELIQSEIENMIETLYGL